MRALVLALALLSGCASSPPPREDVRARIAAFRDGPRTKEAAADLERYLHTQTEDHTLIEVAPGRWLVASGVRREPARTIVLAGRALRYALVTYDDVLVAPPGPRLAARVVDRTIYVDRAELGDDTRELDGLAAITAASLIFRDPDPVRRDAQIVVAIAAASESAAKLVFRLATIRPPYPVGILVAGAIRDAGFGDRALEDLDAEQRRKVMETARRPGGLLDTARKSR